MKEPYEKGVAIRSAPSFALGAAKYSAKRKQGYRWAGYRASKSSIGTPTLSFVAEGHMRKAQEIERLQLSSSFLLPVWLGVEPELNPARFVWVQLQTEIPQPFPEIHQDRSASSRYWKPSTHICGKKRDGIFVVKRKTVGKRLRAKLEQIKLQLRHRTHDPIAHTGKWLKSVVQGYFNYHAIPGNTNSLRVFRFRITQMWRKVLIRRGQRHRLNWARMQRLAKHWLPEPRVLHPYPSVRFDAMHPR